MSAEFERQKNVQASLYTIGVSGALLLLFFLIHWSIPVEVNQPPVEEVIDINLGNSNVGSGKDQPQLPGEPATARQTAYVPPQPVRSEARDDSKDIDNSEQEKTAPPVIKPSVVKPNATKVNTENKTIKTNTPPQQVVVQAPPKPKAVLGHTMGGNGNGGNGADSYKPGTGEGQGGGRGDQGVVGGNPNGKSYTGTPRNFGVRVMSIPNQSFEGDFNQNAKVAMDIVVDDNGHVISATFQPRGSTTADRHYIDIAERSAHQLKMGASQGGQKGTVIFNFKVRG
jgi:hypothetical protein